MTQPYALTMNAGQGLGPDSTTLLRGNFYPPFTEEDSTAFLESLAAVPDGLESTIRRAESMLRGGNADMPRFYGKKSLEFDPSVVRGRRGTSQKTIHFLARLIDPARHPSQHPDVTKAVVLLTEAVRAHGFFTTALSLRTILVIQTGFTHPLQPCMAVNGGLRPGVVALLGSMHSPADTALLVAAFTLDPAIHHIDIFLP